MHERINRRGSLEQLRIVGVSLANAERYGEVLISTVTTPTTSVPARASSTEGSHRPAQERRRVDVVAHLREVPEGTKGSLRSERFDVGRSRACSGGRGPQLAAGYTRPGMRPEEAKKELLGVLEGRVYLGDGR